MSLLQTFLAILFSLSCLGQQRGPGSPVYTPSDPIKFQNKSNISIDGDSISGGASPCILLISCTNVHITHCKLVNSTNIAIRLERCSAILIDSNYIANVKHGVFAIMCPQGGIRVLNNRMKDMQGPFPQAGFIQYDRVAGGNNRICYNRLENVRGESNAEDAINLYKSDGLPGDPILVTHNLVRGGGPGISGAGITAGDGGGSYQKIDSNIVVNTGSGGIQVAGGTYIEITNNIIYSKSLPWSGFGLASSNYSGQPSANNTVAHNQVNWLAGRLRGIRRDTVYKPGSGANINDMPAGWNTNIVNAPIDESVLPDSLVNPK